jgi:VanZ family protein
MLFIFLLSSRPAHDYPEASAMAQKGAHVFLYAVLAILLYRALTAYGLRANWAMLVAWLGAVAYGATDELHQTFVPTRFGNAVDVLVDSVGAATGLVVVQVYRLWRLRQQNLPE